MVTMGYSMANFEFTHHSFWSKCAFDEIANCNGSNKGGLKIYYIKQCINTFFDFYILNYYIKSKFPLFYKYN